MRLGDQRNSPASYSSVKSQFADKTFESSYLNFRYVIQLRKPSSTHYDTGGLNKLH